MQGLGFADKRRSVVPTVKQQLTLKRMVEQ